MSQHHEAQKATDHEASTIDHSPHNPPDTSPFVYSPLANPTEEARLLVLKPKYSSIPGDHIECSLKHVPLFLLSCFNYEAISYTWGSLDDGVKEISLGNKRVNVRTNLWWALEHLRDDFESRLLWIDALCIDRSNVLERNHQVRQMSQVYREASKVLVWLGLAGRKGRAAFDFIINTDAAFLGTQAYRDQYGSSKANLNDLNAFFSMCEREYWSRPWVVQEIVLAKELMVHWGRNLTT
jgi:hypothetical protein